MTVVDIATNAGSTVRLISNQARRQPAARHSLYLNSIAKIPNGLTYMYVLTELEPKDCTGPIWSQKNQKAYPQDRSHYQRLGAFRRFEAKLRCVYFFCRFVSV